MVSKLISLLISILLKPESALSAFPMHSWFHGCSHCPMYMNQYMNSLMVLMTLLLMVVLKGRGQIPNSMTFVMHTFIFKAALSSSAVILFKSPCSFEQSVESQLRSSTNLKLLMWSPCIFTWFFLYHIIKQFKKHTNVNQMQKKKKKLCSSWSRYCK